jgi:hypothetical protein
MILDFVILDLRASLLRQTPMTSSEKNKETKGVEKYTKLADLLENIGIFVKIS